MDLKASQMTAQPCAALHGAVAAPGDKSISHRALIFGALASGRTHIRGLLEGDDVMRSAAAMRALGAEIEKDGDVWRVDGARWNSPEKPLYFGNAGTGARLVMGAVAGAGVAATFEGDASLRARPMGRVLEPLRMMGVSALAQDGKLPARIQAGGKLKSINVKLAQASAQVKSAILLAALGAEGEVRVHEPLLCRDHTERMLEAFGAAIAFEADGEGGRHISLVGGQSLKSCNVMVPGDPSSAAFPVVAALITPGSDVTVKNVLINPLRAGLYTTLKEMGANLTFERERMEGGEPVADIRARHSSLEGVAVPPERAPSMIDEYPILAIAAACAEGETQMHGLEELRVKESDRIASVEAGLKSCGVKIESGPDWMRVIGSEKPRGGGPIKTHHDHRIAMSFLVLGCAAQEPVSIDDASMIATSFPTFPGLMRDIGAIIE